MQLVSRIIVLALLALGLAAPSEAALKVTRHGPRSGTIGGQIRAALFKAGVRQGRVVVKVRRRPRLWSVSVRLYKPRLRGAIFTAALRARRGRLSWAAAIGLARRAAAAYRRGATRREPPVEVIEPAAEGDDGGSAAADAGSEPAAAKDEAPPRPASRPGSTVDEGEDAAAKAKPSPTAAEAPAGPVAQAAPKPMDEDLGFEVGQQSSDAEAQGSIRQRSRPEGSPRGRTDDDRDDRVVLRAHAGIGLAWRRFLLDTQKSAINYESGLFSQFFFQTELYPLHLVTTSGIADVGLRFAYAHSAGLKSEIERAGGSNDSINTELLRLWGGINWRLPRFENPRLPHIELRLGLAHMDLSVEGIEALDTSFTAMAAGGSIVVPIWRRHIELALEAEYRMLVRSRAVALQPYLVQTAAIQGFNLEGGLSGKIVGNLGYRASVTAERSIGDLPALNGGAEMTVRDWYLSMDLALTYEI